MQIQPKCSYDSQMGNEHIYVMCFRENFTQRYFRQILIKKISFGRTTFAC
jgi:hypothetical protein